MAPNLNGGPEMAPKPPTLVARGEAGARLDPRRSSRRGEAGARRGQVGASMFSSRFDHGPLRAAVRADAERQRKRPIRPKPVRHHADLTRRQVDRAGKTVGADEPGVLPQELVDQGVRGIHSLTFRLTWRTMASGPG